MEPAGRGAALRSVCVALATARGAAGVCVPRGRLLRCRLRSDSVVERRNRALGPCLPPLVLLRCGSSEGATALDAGGLCPDPRGPLPGPSGCRGAGRPGLLGRVCSAAGQVSGAQGPSPSAGRCRAASSLRSCLELNRQFLCMSVNARLVRRRVRPCPRRGARRWAYRGE